jgi:hypothetical protein
LTVVGDAIVTVAVTLVLLIECALRVLNVDTTACGGRRAKATSLTTRSAFYREQQGRVTAATCVDQFIPHRGGRAVFGQQQLATLVRVLSLSQDGSGGRWIRQCATRLNASRLLHPPSLHNRALDQLCAGRGIG